MESFFDNPIALLFVSYGIGAFLTPMVKKTAWHTRTVSKNYLTDKWTNYLGVLLLGKIIIATPLKNFNKKLYLQGRKRKNSFNSNKI